MHSRSELHRKAVLIIEVSTSAFLRKSGIPDACNFQIFWSLGTKVCIRRLDRLEDSRDLAGGWVNFSSGQHNSTLERCRVFDVLLGEPFIISTGRKSHGGIVARRTA